MELCRPARALGGHLLALALALSASTPRAQTPIPVMLLDGESGGPYHDWARTTPALKAMLDEAKLLVVMVVTAPPEDC